jgi:hypothetical protein
MEATCANTQIHCRWCERGACTHELFVRALAACSTSSATPVLSFVEPARCRVEPEGTGEALLMLSVYRLRICEGHCACVDVGRNVTSTEGIRFVYTCDDATRRRCKLFSAR